MKKFITIAAALAATGLAAPGLAQDPYGSRNGYGYDDSYGYGYGGIQARIDQLQRRIQIGIQRGTISRQEAGYLRDGFRQLNRLERRYSYDGLSRYERRDLQQRIMQLQQQVLLAERSRGNRYGWDNDRGWNDGRGWDNDRGWNEDRDYRGDRYDDDDDDGRWGRDGRRERDDD